MKYSDYLGDSFDPKTGEFNIQFAKKIIEENKRKETISILLMGATGTGKSSLINAVFGIDVAETGVGVPITQHLEKFNVPEKNLILWDTKGIEAKDYEQTRTQLIADIEKGIEAAASGHEYEMPQIAWLCIKESSGRVEQREMDLLQLMKQYNIPTVVVFTHTQFESGDKFVQAAKNSLNQQFADFLKDRYVRVNSVSYPIMGHSIPVSGLEDLLEATEQCWEDEKGKRIFTSSSHLFLPHQRLLNLRKAQVVQPTKRLDAMVESAKTKVHLAAAAATTAGMSPIPMSDAPIIAAIQATMIYTINSEFELASEKNYMTTVVTGILGMTTIAQVGKTLVSSLLKFIPGAGTVIGGAISGSVAAGITEAIGHAYIALLKNCFNAQTGKVELPEAASTLLEMFKDQYKLHKK